MDLDQLAILIAIDQQKPFADAAEELSFLLDEGWIKETQDGFKSTTHARHRLESILGLFISDKLDPKILENYENQISYEIRHNSVSFVKTKQIKVKLMAKHEIMAALCDRYIKEGWEATHENGVISLKWCGKKPSKQENKNVQTSQQL